MKAGGIMHKVKISVRRLAEFMLKSGDIDRSIGAVSDAEAMAEGRKIHKKIQKLAGPDYRAEVTLKTEYVIDGTLSMVLEGRADGIIEVYKIDGSGEDAAIRTCYTIDEIIRCQSIWDRPCATHIFMLRSISWKKLMFK